MFLHVRSGCIQGVCLLFSYYIKAKNAEVFDDFSSRFIIHQAFDADRVHDVVVEPGLDATLYWECPHSVPYVVSTHPAISVLVGVLVTPEPQLE